MNDWGPRHRLRIALVLSLFGLLCGAITLSIGLIPAHDWWTAALGALVMVVNGFASWLNIWALHDLEAEYF